MRSIVAVLAAATLSAGVSVAPATAAVAGGAGTPAGTILRRDMVQRSGLAQAAAGNRLAFWHSSKCLDIIGYSTADGARAGQWECNAGPNQTWTFEWFNDYEFRLRVAHSQKCLDLVGNSTANGATFGQWTCNTGRNQTFRAYDSGVGGWFFQVQHSGKCIDVIGFATDNGANVGQWDCDPAGTAPNQRIVWI